MSEPSHSSSSYPDLFEEYTPDILHALDTVESAHKPNEDNDAYLQQPERGLKRRRSKSSERKPLLAADEALTVEGESSYMDDAVVYGASRFGRWDEYMSRKRAKLQIQNAEIYEAEGGISENVADGRTEKSKIFQGLKIYVSGYCDVSIRAGALSKL
jgi:DNA repair protein REV1